jgi:hypothetical protein
MAAKNHLERRRDAAQATLDEFTARPFGLDRKNDCAHIALFHLKKLGIKIPVAKVGTYKTPLAARAALRRAFGAETLQEVADKYFERIAPAAALVGDLIEFRGTESPIGAIAVYIGNDTVICYHEEHPEGAIAGRILYEEGDAPLAAWRTLPVPS